MAEGYIRLQERHAICKLALSDCELINSSLLFYALQFQNIPYNTLDVFISCHQTSCSD